MDTSGIITAIAGNVQYGQYGQGGFSGDGGLATQAMLNVPFGVAIDNGGNIYLADMWNHRIRKVDSNGIITTIAGNGQYCPRWQWQCFAGDGGPATQAMLNNPWGVAVDSIGNIYIAESGGTRIRKVDTTGIITTVAEAGKQVTPEWKACYIAGLSINR